MLKLSKPYIPEVTFELLEKVLRSGNLVQGEQVAAFENSLANYLKTGNVILVSSGTAALHLSLIALEISDGDEVILPAYTFPAVANVVELVGATPVFVDITLDDFCINADKIEAEITPKTKAIIAVHEFGQAADIHKIKEIAFENKLFLIEDAACAIGTKFNNRCAGSFGDTGCFSFHPRKMLTTGEGGAVVTHNDMLAGKIRKLRNHGMYFANGKVDFALPGFNYRMTDFQAAIGLSQLNELNETISIHRSQALHYQKLLKNIPEIGFEKSFPERFQTFQTFQIILDKSVDRDYVKIELLKLGIECSIGAYSIPSTEHYLTKYKLHVNNFPNSETAFKNGLALPIGRHLNYADLDYIANSLKSIIYHGF